MPKERIVIVGASVAGARAAETLRQEGFDGEVILVGAERELPYHRPPLSKEMLGHEPIPDDELLIHPMSFFTEREIELHLGVTAKALDAAGRSVTLSSGQRVPFDKLLIATGASPRRLVIPGAGHERVTYLRTLADARRLRTDLQQAERVVIVGAGILGLEVAAAARVLGRTVTVLEQGPTPLRRVFHGELARRVVDLHRRKGVDIKTSVSIVAIEGDRRAEGVRLADGTTVAADLVVVAAGVEPNTSWLRGSGVTVSDGVIVNEIGQTAIPGIYAAGDVARVYNRLAADHLRFEQNGHAHDMGIGVARAMTGQAHSFSATPSASTTVYGIRAQSVGFIRPDLDLVVRGDEERMLGFLLDGGQVVSAFGLDRARDFAMAKRLVASRAVAPRPMLADDAVPLIELAGNAR